MSTLNLMKMMNGQLFRNSILCFTTKNKNRQSCATENERDLSRKSLINNSLKRTLAKELRLMRDESMSNSKRTMLSCLMRKR